MDIPHVGAGQAGACLMMIAFGVLLPFGSLIVWKIISKKPVSPYFCGWLVYLLFSLVLQGILTSFLMKAGTPMGDMINASPALYTALAAIMAGVIEETGRLFAFKVMLKKHSDRKTSVTYGLGYGGFETLIVLLIGGVSMLLSIISINSGAMQQQIELMAKTNPEQAQMMMDSLSQITQISMGTACLSVLERVMSIVLNVSLSMIVFCAARVSGKFWLYPAAVVMRAVFSIPSVLYQKGVITELAVVEVLFAVMAAGAFVFAYCVVYKKWMSELVDEEPPIIPMNM